MALVASGRDYVSTLRLTGSALLFYIRCPELHAADVTLDIFKEAFCMIFRDAHSNQFHFMQLQTARQRKGEIPQEFADKYRAIANKVMCKVNNSAAQRIQREKADCMMLASFVAGLLRCCGHASALSCPTRFFGSA